MPDELDRLFECLVETLAKESRLAIPLVASEVYERLVPYRLNRSRLKVATHQDYEMTVLRLLAGERGYVRLEPEDVREGMQREVTSANPDPAYFRNFPDARVMVSRRAAEQFLMGELLYAPPAPEREADAEAAPDEAADEPVDYTSENPIPFPPAAAPLPFSMDGATTNQCPYCGGSLPAGRKMNFCPHCGQPPSGELKCPACGS
ncbi:MAG: zinc ribbon domain-containing protein, partial [Gemmatimonadales bacterium]